MKFELKTISKERIITAGSDILHWGISNAPTIETYSGLGFILGGTIWACSRTLRLHGILEVLRNEVKEIKEDFANGVISEREYAKALTRAYSKWALKVARNYAGSAAMITLGYSLVIKAHHDDLTRIASLTTLLRESTDRENRLEQAIIDNYGPEVLEKLKKGEPVGEIGHLNDDGTVDKEEVYDELEDFDFVWHGGMGEFCPHDNAMNYRLVREYVLYFNMARRRYGIYAPINDIFRKFGAFDKVRTIYDVNMYGYPNARGEDGEYGLEIDITEMPFNIESDRKKQSAPDLLIHFRRKPISCLKYNIKYGFCSD